MVNVWTWCPVCWQPVRVNQTDKVRKHRRQVLVDATEFGVEECLGSGAAVKAAPDFPVPQSDTRPPWEGLLLPDGRVGIYSPDYQHTDLPIAVLPAPWVDMLK